MCDEHLLEGYLSGNPIEENQIREIIRARKLFPCYFGSALKGQGVEGIVRRNPCLCPVLGEGRGGRKVWELEFIRFPGTSRATV